MKSKKVLLIIPSLSLPYIALLSSVTTFFSNKNVFFEFIMDTVFQGNGLLLIGSVFVYGIIATLLSIVFFVLALKGKHDAYALSKTALTVKLILIPSYVIIFVLGLLLAISLFTIPFAIGLFLVDCATLFSSGMIAVAASVNATRQGLLDRRIAVIVNILQFFFCIDIVAALILFIELKKSKAQ